MKKLLAGLASELYKINIKSIALDELIKEASAFDDFKAKYPQHADIFKNVKPAYYIWISKRLEEKEPAVEILSLINDFELYKQGLEKKDINQYRGLGDLRGTLELYLAKREERKEMEEAMKMAPGPEREQLLSRIKNKPKKKSFDTSESVVIYEDDKFLVVFPITTAASQRLGKDTQWCTAATQTENYFSIYQSDGIRLYYILTKDGSGDNLSKIAYAMVKQGPTSNQTIYDSQNNEVKESLVSRHLNKSFYKIKSSISEHFSTQADTDVSGYYSRITPEDLAQALATQNFTKDQINSIYKLIQENNTNPEVLNLIEAERDNFKYLDPSGLLELYMNNEDAVEKEEARKLLLEKYPLMYAIDVDNRSPNDETREATLKNPYWALWYAKDIDYSPRNDTRNATLVDPSFAFEYAETVDKAPRDDTRNASLDSPSSALNYASYVDKAPRDDTRNAASLNPKYAVEYADLVDKSPHDVTRSGASKDPTYAYKYAEKIDKGPNDITRKGVLPDPELAYHYAINIDKGPHKDTRNAMTDNFLIARYERQVDKLSQKDIAAGHKKRNDERAEKERLKAIERFNAGEVLVTDWGDENEYD